MNIKIYLWNISIKSYLKNISFVASAVSDFVSMNLIWPISPLPRRSKAAWSSTTVSSPPFSRHTIFTACCISSDCLRRPPVQLASVRWQTITHLKRLFTFSPVAKLWVQLHCAEQSLLLSSRRRWVRVCVDLAVYYSKIGLIFSIVGLFVQRTWVDHWWPR